MKPLVVNFCRLLIAEPRVVVKSRKRKSNSRGGPAGASKRRSGKRATRSFSFTALQVLVQVRISGSAVMTRCLSYQQHLFSDCMHCWV